MIRKNTFGNSNGIDILGMNINVRRRRKKPDLSKSK